VNADGNNGTMDTDTEHAVVDGGGGGGGGGGATLALHSLKSVNLGTQPITLETFTCRDKVYVFAACDRPTVIYSSSSSSPTANHKLSYTNVNVAEVTVMCSFHSELFPECVSMASEAALTIGNIDDIQKLDVQTFPLKEQPRRICQLKHVRAVAVATCNTRIEEHSQEMLETNHLRIFDDRCFTLLDSFDLDAYELSMCVSHCQFEGPSACVVCVCLGVVDCMRYYRYLYIPSSSNQKQCERSTSNRIGSRVFDEYIYIYPILLQSKTMRKILIQ
jgi:hypothetical protein